MKRLLVAAFAGLILGTVVSKYLFVGSWLNLLLWGADGRKDAARLRSFIANAKGASR